MKKISIILFSVCVFLTSVQTRISANGLSEKIQQHPVATGAVVAGTVASAVLIPLIIKDLKKNEDSKIRQFLKLSKFVSFYCGSKIVQDIKNHPVLITSALAVLGVSGFSWYDLSKGEQSLLKGIFDRVCASINPQA